MSRSRKILKKLAEFRDSDRKFNWIWNECKWRYFNFRHRKQARLNFVFDQERGVETAAEVPLEAVGVSSADAARGNAYYRPLTEVIFRAAIAAMPIDVSKFTFVDIGSGKGKVLFMAADLPFRSILGIEYAPGLHAVALKNVANYHYKTQQCQKIEAVHADALQYGLPEGPLVLFTFNALDRPTMTRLLQKLDDAATAESERPLFIIYTNVRTVSEVGNVFSRLAGLRVIHRMRHFVILANEAGLRFGT
jgi:SAM-dependent methyltransferase